MTELPFPVGGRRLPLLFFVAVTLFYLAFSPGTIEGMGYYGENLTAADGLAANLIHAVRCQSLEAMKWTRHGGLELIFELPFALVSQLVFGGSVKWLGRLMALQPILATALLCTLLFVWLRRATGSLAWSYALALTAALATMFWPYAYIGLETTQSLCLFGAAYLALGRAPRQTWPEVMAMAFCCACAVGVKLNGGFLFPAVAYLLLHYFRAAGPQRALKAAAAVVVILALYVLNYRLKTIFWADLGGSTGYFLNAMVSDPATALIQAFSYFGSANKSLLIYAPIVALSLWKLPEAFRVDRRVVIFALLVLGGLVGGFSLVTVWAEETWGPRYLHSAIAPLVICLAATKSLSEAHGLKRLILAATLGLLVNLPGALVSYTGLHLAATNSSRSTLTALQYDPAFNHVRFNYRLLGLWLAARFGGANQPVPWPPPPAWWFAKPADAASEKAVDLRQWAMPQSAVLRAWTPAMHSSPRQHLLLRLLLGGCFGLSLTLFLWLTALVRGQGVRSDDYIEWIAQNEPSADQLQQQRMEAEQFAHQPLISIVTPVYNTPPRLLDEMIRSVVGQTYDRWQLCLADGSSTNEETSAVLREWAQKESRITVRYLNQNLGISGNSNAALQLAKGEFIALLDHDDLLAPFALYEAIKLLNERPETDVIYSDRDLVSEDSAQRFSPFFKPDWSPEMLLAVNYLCHLCLIRKSVVMETGEFNPALDGAQDWDFFLRVTERTNRVVHIPKVLYHWRQWSNSTASSLTAKPYAIIAQKHAVRERLRRRKLAAEVDISPSGFISAVWAVTGKTKVSIVILAEEKSVKSIVNLELLLARTNYRNFELLLGQPHGVDQVPISYLRESTPEISIKLFRFEKRMPAPAAFNLAAAQATGQLLLFLGETVEPMHGGWLEEMVRWAELPGVGIVGAKLLDVDGRIKHAGMAIGLNGLAGYPLRSLPEGHNGIFGSTEWYRNWSAVAGDCLLIRKELFEQFGGFNKNASHSDIELCLRANSAGQSVVYTPYARLKHSGLLRRHFTDEALAPAQLLIQAVRGRDPFYSPNLSTQTAIPQLSTGKMSGANHA